MAHVSVRLGDDFLSALDQFAREYEPPLSRSDAVRALLGEILAKKGLLEG